MNWRITGLVFLIAAIAGCGKNGPAEVPKNPVPMEKPGGSANLEAGKAGPGPKPQPGPGDKAKKLP